jgi:peptidoglycan/LPS O-acetylase OafA/YrhL
MNLGSKKINRNNLNVVRLGAAILVLYGHSFIFLGLPNPLFLSWLPLGVLGVYIFFTISGYLITESWDRDPNLLRFIARRMLRIFPGLIVCVFLSILVLGPVFTTLPLKKYLESQYTWGYLKNIGLYITYYLPGLFETNRVPNAVNGSLWSLPVEFLMYIFIAILGCLHVNRWAIAILGLISGIITLFWAQQTSQMIIVYATDLRQVFICGTYFLVGALFYKFDLKRFFSITSVTFAFISLVILTPLNGVLNLFAWVLLPTIVLAFGLSYSRILNRLTSIGGGITHMEFTFMLSQSSRLSFSSIQECL